MIEVKIYNRDPNSIMEIVRELRASGLKQGQDFDFAYNKPTFDDHWHEVEPRHTVFTFHVEKHATFFALKYSS